MKKDKYNPDALLYDNHQVKYPQHLKRKYWVELARRERITIRDDPDGPVPCRYEHDRCIEKTEEIKRVSV